MSWLHIKCSGTGPAVVGNPPLRGKAASSGRPHTTSHVPPKLIGLHVLLTLITTIFFLQSTSHAKELLKTKTFKTDFISFELSDQWNCIMDGTEYVCRPIDKQKKSDAIIIIAAKIPGADDNLKAYYNYLKEPKKITDYKGQTLTSKVSLIKNKEIEGTEWVDAIHLSSELKDFYTRYLATVKSGIAILVTYSVSKPKNSLYAAELNKMITSLKILAKPPQLAAPPQIKPEPPKTLAPKSEQKEAPQQTKPQQPVIIIQKDEKK